MASKNNAPTRPATPGCAHCHADTLPCPLEDNCPGTRPTGTPAPCTRCHNGRLCPRHGRLWAGAL